MKYEKRNMKNGKTTVALTRISSFIFHISRLKGAV